MHGVDGAYGINTDIAQHGDYLVFSHPALMYCHTYFFFTGHDPPAPKLSSTSSYTLSSVRFTVESLVKSFMNWCYGNLYCKMEQCYFASRYNWGGPGKKKS